MPTPVLRDAYEQQLAAAATTGKYPGYWEMSWETHLLFKMDGQDFCGLPINTNPSAPLGEWWLYPADPSDPLWRDLQQKVVAT